MTSLMTNFSVLVVTVLIALISPSHSNPQRAFMTLGKIPAWRNPVAGENYNSIPPVPTNQLEVPYGELWNYPDEQTQYLYPEFNDRCPQRTNDEGDGLAIYRRDPYNCDRFKMCSWGKLFTFKCPKGQLWDHAMKVCNFEDKVYCPYGSYYPRY